ncbi:NAD-dependent epimerase/dehydratase family protein [Streptomyces sp. NPDC048172]|uniref:NAD-dependent epimerase/dehydratase family protein n=1 Tax=Streptomyces sp. NPDC048172 TaxID=3365505 RepID=UPI0037241B9B
MLTLVTGATGQVGRRFVPRLLRSAAPGEQVRVLVRDAARGERFAGLGAEVLVGDLRDTEALAKATAGADAVVNVAAAFRGVPDEEARAVNRDAAIELGRAAVASGVRRFVQVSTGLVYGEGRGRALVEDDETVPGSHMWGAYPESKWEAERALGELDGLDDLRIGRLPFVYGDGDPHLDNVMEWAPHWPAMQRLHMGHHVDVAQALRRLLYAPGAHGVYNIADDAPVTTVDLFGIHGLPVPPEVYERETADPWHGVMSTARIRRELGYRPMVPSVWTAQEAGLL